MFKKIVLACTLLPALISAQENEKITAKDTAALLADATLNCSATPILAYATARTALSNSNGKFNRRLTPILVLVGICPTLLNMLNHGIKSHATHLQEKQLTQSCIAGAASAAAVSAITVPLAGDAVAGIGAGLTFGYLAASVTNLSLSVFHLFSK